MPTTPVRDLVIGEATLTLVQDILAAQAKLDQMKAEVNTILRLCGGSIAKYYPAGGFETARLESSEGYWRIMPVLGQPLFGQSNNDDPLIDYTTIDRSTPHDHTYVRSGYANGKVTCGGPHDVIATHRALDTLIAGVFEMFPKVGERWNAVHAALMAAA